MSSDTPCPSERELLQLGLGQLAADRAERVTAHVAGCDRCQDTLAALGVENTLLGEVGAETPPARPAVSKPGNNDRSDDDLELTQILAPAQAKDELGRLGPYRVLRVLGRGGMGVVLLAEDIQLRRRVALKCILPTTSGSGEARKRFLREARAAAAIDHDNVVTIYHVGEDRNVPFLAMQFLQGETLGNRVRRNGPLPVMEVLRIARETAEGLQAAHERSVIHRDIKPENIWLQGNRSRVKIVDFGIARASVDDVQLTRTGTVMGTPAYMSPEQARGAMVDRRTDLYSLGCVIYHMATGRPPFQADDTFALLAAVAHDRPPDITVINPDMPEILDALVERLMAKHQDARPNHAGEVVEVLEAIEQHVAARLAAGQSLTWDGQPRSAPPHRRLPTLAAATLFAAAGFGIYFLLPRLLELIRCR
jgi:serine/threonine protein kinase